MIPSTLCILPESLGKELNQFGIPHILKMFQMPTASLSATVVSGGPYQQLRIVALNLYSVALSDASTKSSHFFLKKQILIDYVF